MHIPVSLVLYLVVPLLCLPGVTFRKDASGSISRDMTLSIRGIGMLLIVFVHSVEGFINKETFFIYVSGVLGVSACFLVSGYGLHKSVQQKENYLKGFLQTKALRMLIPYAVLFVVYLGFSLASSNVPPVSVIVTELCTLQLNGLLLWYLKVQLLCYVIFYLCYRYLSGRRARLIAVTTAVFLWMGIAIVLDLGTSWYNTCLFFPLGLFLSEYESSILRLLRKPLCIALNIAATLMLFGVIYFFGRFGLDLLYDWGYMLVFNAALIGLLMYFHGSRLLNAFGKYSMEIYLLHLLLLKGNPFSFFRADSGISYLLIAILSLAAAVPLFWLCNRIMKPIKKHYT